MRHLLRRVLVGTAAFALVGGPGLTLPVTAAATPPTTPPVVAPATPVVVEPGAGGAIVSTYVVDTTGARAARRAAKAAERLGGTVTLRYTTVLHGFAVRLTGAQARTLRGQRGVVTVAPDRKIIAAPCLSCPPGPLTREDVTSWGLLRLSSRGPVSLEPDQPNGPLYVADSDGEGVTAYVLDSGIDAGQAELSGRVLPGHDFVDDDADASDCTGHGTRVGEIVGGDVSGVADRVRLVPLRVFDCADEGTWSTVIAALDWAVVHRPAGPAVVNLSGAGHAFALGDRAVRATVRAGLPVVVSAGNVHDDACRYSPARTGAALTVAASTIADRRAPSSDFGRCVDLFAAGEDVVTTSGTVSGTSFAAAHVTGAVARYLENHRRARPAEVARYLRSNATRGALTDVQGAPNRLLYLPAPVAPSAPRQVGASVDDSANTVTVTWRRPASTGSAPITAYQVCLIDVDVFTQSPGGQCVTTPASARTVTLGVQGDGVHPEDGGVYQARVAAVGKAGSEVAGVEVRLAHELPSAPEISTTIDEEAFGVLVFVTTPDQDFFVGPITGWRLTIDRDDDGVADETVVVPPQDSPFNYHEFFGLERGQTVTVTAALVTADGAGPAASATLTYPS